MARLRATSGRVLAAAIGIPLVIAAAGNGAFTLVGLYAHTSEHHAASYDWHGGELSLNTSSGNVKVVTGSGSEIGVSYTEHYQLKKPKVTSTQTGGGVQLVAKCPSGWFGSNCDINYVLTVPAAIRLTIHSGGGNLRITGVSGIESLDTGYGGIDLDSVTGAITAQTGDGAISGAALRSSSLQATTGNGSVHLVWANTPKQVATDTGDGSINIVVPAGSGPYRVSTTTGNGGHHVDVPDDSNASSSISAHTGNGSIVIGYPAS